MNNKEKFFFKEKIKKFQPILLITVNFDVFQWMIQEKMLLSQFDLEKNMKKLSLLFYMRFIVSLTMKYNL